VKERGYNYLMFFCLIPIFEILRVGFTLLICKKGYHCLCDKKKTPVKYKVDIEESPVKEHTEELELTDRQSTVREHKKTRRAT